MTFNEADVIRDGKGKFSEKQGSAADVTLTPTPELDTIQVGREHPLAQKYETRKERVEVFLQEIEQQVEKLQDDEQWNRYLDAVALQPKYSFSNQMLIAIQSRGTSELCMSAGDWKKLGRWPRKGSTGYRIQAPVFKNVEETDAKGNVKHGPDGKPLMRRQLVDFRAVPTFDLKQTDGEPLDMDVYPTLSETPPAGFEEDLNSAIAEKGFTVEEASDFELGKAQGATSFERKTVLVRAGLTDAERVRTLAHELGHITAEHGERMDEYHTNSAHGGTGQRGAMEVEAESIAYVLMRSNGMQPTAADRSGRYIAGWASVQKDDPEVVRKAGERVAKASRELLLGREWANTRTMTVEQDS